MEVKLNSQQAAELAKLANYLDINQLPVSTTEEGPSAEEIMFMGTDEIEQLSYRGSPVVIKVDPSVEQKIADAVTSFQTAQNWYEEFHDNITGLLGDSDGSLFLCLLAVFSANQSLEENLYTATEAYHAFLDDVHERPDILKQFFEQLTITGKNLKQNAMDLAKSNDEFKNLSLNHIMGKTMSGHFDNAFRIMNFYVKSGFKLDRNVMVSALESTLDSTGRLPSDRGEKAEVSIVAQKIFNFSLNLLKPGHEIENYNWFPVTIDTHMISFFYPYMDTEMKKKVISSYKQYVYLAKIVQKYSAKFGMKPHQLQAVLWVARLAEISTNPNKNMQFALNSVIDKMTRRATAFQKMSGFVDQLKSQIG